MQVLTERVILETDRAGHLTRLPTLPPNRRVEAIFMILDEPEASVKPRRRPHVDIIGKTQIVGDIMDSVPVSDWDLLA